MWSCGVALALASLAAPPLLAQETSSNTATPAPAPTPAPDTIGPEQLRDFTLPGTVTRRTESLPAGTADTGSGAGQPEAQPSNEPSLAVRTRPVASTAPSRSVTVALPPADPLSQEPTLAPPAIAPQTDLSEPVVPSGAGLPATESGGSWMPWLLALLLVAAGGAFLLWRQRSAARPAYAGADRSERFAGTAPAVTTAPVAARVAQPSSAPAPAPAPKSIAPKSDGIISTGLRPWLEIEFGATRAVVTDDAATIHFDVVLYNSGSAVARDVRVEGRMFNAGPDQDSELGAFFDRPAVEVQPIPEIAPLTKVEVRSAVALPRANVREYEVEGRKLFVPILGFNAHYRFGRSEGQTSASFIVGRGGNDGGKMAPIRLDLGPRIFRGLNQRLHSVGVRA
jgi:hypothetical protein